MLPPPRRLAEEPRGELPVWSGALDDPQNQGAYLEVGEWFCSVGDPRQLEAWLTVEQGDVEFVRAQQRVRLQYDPLPGRFLTGRVAHVAEIDLETAPPELLAAGDLPIEPSLTGPARLAGVYYQVRVTLDAHEAPLLPRGRGRAKIEAAPLSWGRRLIRYLNRTFRLSH